MITTSAEVNQERYMDPPAKSTTKVEVKPIAVWYPGVRE